MAQNSEANWFLRIFLGVVALFVVALFVYNIMNPTKAKNLHTDGPAWNQKMLLGNQDAPNKFVEYTDYFCSFCEKVLSAAGEEFEKDYIKNGKLNMENRVITVLKELSPNTEQGAQAAYCSAEQDKYWQYSRHIVPRIKSDYWDKGIGTKETTGNLVPIEKLPLEYFLVSARAVGLDEDKFADCVTNEKYKDDVEKATNKAIQLGVTGLPYMVVNNYQSSGFTGGYNALKLVLKAGGVE